MARVRGNRIIETDAGLLADGDGHVEGTATSGYLASAQSGSIVAIAQVVADGSTDNKAVIDAAIDAANSAGGGGVLLRKVSATGTIATSGGHSVPKGVYLVGLGEDVTVIKHTGNNACLTYTEGGSPTGVSAMGGHGFKILGNSGASAIGIDITDLYGAHFEDVEVGGVTAGDAYTNGIGWRLNNVSYWTEAVTMRRCRSTRNATGLQLQRANAVTATNSFGYCDLQITIDVPTSGTGIDFGGTANNASLFYHGALDVHMWVGVAGNGVSNAIGVRVRSNFEVPTNTWANIRIEPKGGGTGNYSVQNDGGKFNPRGGGVIVWADVSIAENRVGGTSLMHGAEPARALDPTAAVPSGVGYDDAWVPKHGQFGITAKSNEEATYSAGFSFTSAPIHRFAAKAFTADPTAAWNVETSTKMWVRADGAVCFGLVSDPRVIVPVGSATPEAAVTGNRGDVAIRKGTNGASLYVKSRGDATNTDWVNISQLKGSKTWDPASTATGAITSTTVTVTGAAIGDICTVGYDNGGAALPAGVILFGTVTATDTVTVTLLNQSATNPFDGASGTLAVRVQKNL